MNLQDEVAISVFPGVEQPTHVRNGQMCGHAFSNKALKIAHRFFQPVAWSPSGMGGASGKVAKLLQGGADQKLFEEIFKSVDKDKSGALSKVRSASSVHVPRG